MLLMQVCHSVMDQLLHGPEPPQSQAAAAGALQEIWSKYSSFPSHPDHMPHLRSGQTDVASLQSMGTCCKLVTQQAWLNFKDTDIDLTFH